MKKKIRKVFFFFMMFTFVMGVSEMTSTTVQAEAQEEVRQTVNEAGRGKKQEEIQATNKKIKKLFFLSILSVLLFVIPIGIALVVCIRAKRKERKK